MTDHSLTFELVNDKAELEEALEILNSPSQFGEEYGEFDCNGHHHSEDVSWALDRVCALVPRLMASYEEALQLTHTLADAWESYLNDQTPAGIYVPS